VAIEAVPGTAWVAATGVGLIACALLVVNNLRDIPSDTVAGKQALAVRLGDARTRWFYVVLVAGTFVCVVVSATLDRPWALLGLLGIPASIAPVHRVLDQTTRGPALVPVLVATGQVQLVFGLTFAFGLAI
jgi:1,4-dihydroxy-2-naphthoate octaprenyltransferase